MDFDTCHMASTFNHPSEDLSLYIKDTCCYFINSIFLVCVLRVPADVPKVSSRQ